MKYCATLLALQAAAWFAFTQNPENILYFITKSR